MPRWIWMAQFSASMTLSNAANRPSPAVLMIRPRRAAIVGPISSCR